MDKDKIVSDLVKVKGCRKKRGGKKTLKERMVALVILTSSQVLGLRRTFRIFMG